MPSLSKLAISRLCRDGDAGSGECGERRKNCRRYPRTGSYSAGGWLDRPKAEGSRRRRRFAQRVGVGGAVSGGTGVSLFFVNEKNAWTAVLRDCFPQLWFIIIGLLLRVVDSGVINEISWFEVVCSARSARNRCGGAGV